MVSAVIPGGVADVLGVASCRLPAEGVWLRTVVADGNPGCEFTARVLCEAMPSARGGDVVIRLVPEGPARGPRPAVWIGVYAVLNGQLVPAGFWPGHDPGAWPERIRLTVAFALAVLAELREHRAGLGPARPPRAPTASRHDGTAADRLPRRQRTPAATA